MKTRRPKTKVQDKSALLYSLLESAVEKIDVIGTRMECLDKKLDLHIQKTEFEFKGLNELDAAQNSLLEEHHQRSIELKRDNDLKEKELRTIIASKEAELKAEMEKREAGLRTDIIILSKRLSKTEIPQKYLFWTKKVCYWIIAAVGAGTAIFTFLQWLRGL